MARGLAREKKMEIVGKLHWDFDVSSEELLEVIEGERECCGPFTKETLFARCLGVLVWQDVARLWGVEKCASMYTDNVRRMLFPRELRSDYDELFRILRGGALQNPGRGAEKREKLRDAILFNRRNRAEPRVL